MNDWKRGLHDLLLRVALHDEEAFTRMFETLHRTAIATILSDVGGLDEDDAEVIYNQAMLKVWRKADTYQGREERQDPDTTAWAWIRATILHTALDVSRKLRRRAMTEISESEMDSPEQMEEAQDLSPIDQLSSDEIAPEERRPESPALLAETHEGLVAFLSSLEPRDRRIFRLLAEGRPQGEVAASLGISPSRLSQIVHALRDKAGRYMRP